MTEINEPEVLIPEVLPPDEPMGSSGPLKRKLRAIVAGLAVDFLDFVLRGAIGSRLGLPIGFVVGVLLGRYMKLSWTRTALMGLVTGIYCFLPGTYLLPLGLIIALLGGPSSKSGRTAS